MSKIWASEEINFLRINRSIQTIEELSLFLNRSKSAVISRLCKLGIVKNLKIKKGDIFGRLTIIGKDNNSTPGNPFYMVKCSCDNKIVSVRGSSLREGNTISCGCFQKEARFKSSGVSSWNTVIMRCKKGAESRNHTFDLSSEYFISISIQDCHYCGSKPKKYNKYLLKNGSNAHPRSSLNKENIDRSWIELNGLDRIDNNVGYIEGNVVPCCTICNHAKHTLPYEEFINYLDNLVKFRIFKAA